MKQPAWNRRLFLQTAAGATLALTWPAARRAQGDEVAWLDDVQRPPDPLPPAAETLSSLLVSPDGTPIDTQDAWEKERLRLRAAWLEFLGPMPEERPAVKLEVLHEERLGFAATGHNDAERLDACIRRLVRYEGEPGLPVEGYLLLPHPLADSPRAGIVALHQTNDTSIEEIAGVNGPEVHHLGLRLCRRGFVVFCPRCYLWQTPPGYQIDVKQTVADFKKRHPHTLGMMKMLFDAQRAVDVLASQPEVDPQRIGAMGHSLGSKETLYLAAFDDRIRAAVASEGGVGFKFTNWADPWYLGEGIQSPDFPLSHHQVLAMAAPRAMLILAGESGKGAADGDRTWPYVEAAMGVYKLYGGPPRLGLLNHRQGHSIPPDVFERLAEWLTVYTA